MSQTIVQQPQNETNDDITIPSKPLGPEGPCGWVIRIVSFLIYVGAVIINYFVGLQIGAVSDKYHLYVTPPSYFFTIWAVIFTGLAIVNIYNLLKNQWTKQVHLWFTLSNIFLSLWVLIFNIGNNAAVFACSLIIIILAALILKTWYALGDRPQKSFNFWTYATRNAFAFYLGWVIAATNLNLGFNIVYWWGASKQTQLAIFWVMAPLCAIGATAFNAYQQGKRGILSCFVLWASVIWAFSGAGITSQGCLAKTLTLC